ncbi:hypothetical protein CANTEDRAFT_120262 [Yamadazyma tenuis ATCC 10573]|uniref:MFS general substrate transporter n=1 Tax=Candida tenuis (strain ATCC 10573 / BCRC 21748 / CBS 615 / JCM 9827 / NBRC 10315 / NRRL Y-1498 / VKM Y-70) TaxID=590646 RepID=G3B225_CANTC|nr:uncharacterized protein CANTEDRAFT_120262 [Yamadazyma tenuis ATCC 10573]EGV64589.1 hypothetical protein CANTEDRAFT_120262 [Yamadazyma tenuis ATCC 10573]
MQLGSYNQSQELGLEHPQNPASNSYHDDSESIISVQVHEKNVEKEHKEQEEELIFDRGYCWVVCFAAALLNASTWGMNSGFAIYFSTYLNDDIFEGATKLDYAAVGGIAFGATLVFTPFVNYVQGVIGTRPLIMVGNCCQFTALMLASFSTKLWQLYLSQGLLQSVGLALISLPALTILPQFFKKKRMLSGGLAAAGSGFGGVTFNLGMQKVVQIRGVHWALRAQAIISFGLVWIAVLLFRSRSKLHKIEFTLYDVKVTKMYAFWIGIFYVMTCMFGYVLTLYTVANYTTSLGYSDYQGSIAAALLQIGSAVGRPCVGLLADRYGATTMAAHAYLISTIFCLAMWIPSRNYATVLVFAFVIGGVMGSVWGTIAPILSSLVGIKKMNIAFSQLWIVLGMSGVVSPVIGVALVKGSGGHVDPTQYVNCSIFAGVSFFACSICLYLLRGYMLARNKIILKMHSGSQDMDNLELNSDLLVSTPVPIGQMIKSSFLFRNVKV